MTETAVGSKKIAIFYRKSEKTAFPTPWKDKITQFLRFQPLGKTKMPRKPPVVGRRNEKYSKNCSLSADETENHPQNCVSGHPDGRKLAKTAFRGTPTSRNWRKLRFGAPRRAEISKNSLSGHPGGRKLRKTTFRGTPTGKNCSDTGVNHRLAPSVARFFPRIKKNSLGKRHLGYRFSENYINFVLHLSLRLRLLRGSSSKAATEFRQNAFLQR